MQNNNLRKIDYNQRYEINKLLINLSNFTSKKYHTNYVSEIDKFYDSLEYTLTNDDFIIIILFIK
jgi:hypothetical protein